MKAAVLEGNKTLEASEVTPVDPLVILFKNDLRVDDHPGLHRALQSGRRVIPFYCLDVRLVQSITSTPGGVELLWGALVCLRTSIRNLGSDLVFRIGRLSDTLTNFMKGVNSKQLLTEAEADVKWRSEIETFKAQAPGVSVEDWACRMRDAESYSQNFKQTKQSSPVLEPLNAPSELASSLDGFDVGQVPDLEEFRRLVMDGRRSYDSDVDPFERTDTKLWADWSLAMTSEPHSRFQLLGAYLSSTPNPNGNKASLLNQLISSAEHPSLPGISFASLFSLSMSLGLISPRRVYSAAQTAREQQQLPWLQKTPFYEAAITNSESYDFCSHVHNDILQNGCSGSPGNSTHASWRWREMFTEYSVARPRTASKGSVVLVHGFGASCMHWRRNVDALVAAGYTVYCPSLPGYGRSQKLYIKYTQVIWKEFLIEFITNIVKEPAVLAGNSIGAFVATQTAADHPDVVSALVLINPAGPLVPDYAPTEENGDLMKRKPPSFLIDVFSQALLFYLSKTAGRILRRVYPVKTNKADEGFLDEILRAADDPNAIALIKSVFFIKRPRPLNYLLSEMYGGPVLLLQGALDPLNNAKDKGQRIQELCKNVQVEMVEAGHCAHDEVPEVVNQHFITFLNRLKTQSSTDILKEPLHMQA